MKNDKSCRHWKDNKYYFSENLDQMKKYLVEYNLQNIGIKNKLE